MGGDHHSKEEPRREKGLLHEGAGAELSAAQNTTQRPVARTPDTSGFPGTSQMTSAKRWQTSTCTPTTAERSTWLERRPPRATSRLRRWRRSCRLSPPLPCTPSPPHRWPRRPWRPQSRSPWPPRRLGRPWWRSPADEWPRPENFALGRLTNSSTAGEENDFTITFLLTLQAE